MATSPFITAARFWSKVQVARAAGACWEWQAARNSHGYGHFKLYGTMMSAHRYAFYLKHQRYPNKGMVVRHTCDNPGCVNPDHLLEGTQRDNANDMVARGRQVVRDQKGENNGAAKLKMSQVNEIKARIAAGEKNTTIAPDYGVTHQMISKIRRGHVWQEPANDDEEIAAAKAALARMEASKRLAENSKP